MIFSEKLGCGCGSTFGFDISNFQGEITETDITKHYPPDPTSMIFWLKNRRPDRWRDKQSIDIGVRLEDVLAALPEDLRDQVSAELGKFVSSRGN